MSDPKTTIELPDFITVRELAGLMETSPIDVIKELMNNGIMANINQPIDFDTAAIVAEEMGFEAVPHVEEVEEAGAEGIATGWQQILEDEDEEDLQPRPPVITMLGHVDHGKTSLLDVIRQADVQSGEAGGITQHIGAYQISHEGRLITFLDTPGHKAFTAMRARGARATDIAVLVVAADDGVMPQTIEAADHAKAAGVSVIVALNKIDLANAQPDSARQGLAEIGLVPDDWDGEIMVIPVSARERTGIDDLLQAILLTTDEIAPRANPNASPSGTVLEAQMEKGRGVVATVLVQNGTLKTGDTVMAGKHFGRVKAMFDSRGKAVREAGPSTPVAISGLSTVPSAGDQFVVVESEKEARRIVAEQEIEVAQVAPTTPMSLDEFFGRLQEGVAEELRLIIKVDVQGSLEPIVASLNELSGEETKVNILRAATGDISEGDVMLASASDAIVLGFNVAIDPVASVAAATQSIQIKLYNIIYKLIEDIENSLKGLLDPIEQEKIVGRAEIRQVFHIKSAGSIAGCFMRVGEARRRSRVRVIRDGHLLYSGRVSSLKHLQENVREVKTGFEFGVAIGGWSDYQPGDILEFFIIEEVER